jgi:acyl-CoA dehydrogenase
MTITETIPSETATSRREVSWKSAADRAQRIAPFAAEHDREGTFVYEAFELLREEGFISALVPEEFGGAGVTHAEAGRILTELAKGDPSVAATLSMHYHLVATQVWRHKHDQPAEAVLRKVADNDVVLVSTGAADWVSSYGEAVKVEGGFRISARKSPSSGGPTGDILVTSAPWRDSPDGPRVIHCAIPFSAEGVSVEETWNSMGLRGTGSDTVVLDDVFVPDVAVSLIRPADEWHLIWSAVLGSAMPLIMSAYLGIAESAAEQALAYARRKSSQPEIQTLVGELLNQLTSARDSVAEMLASSENLTFAPSVEHTATVLSRKTVATEAMIATVRLAMDICGGMGFSVDSGLERLYRDVHGALYHPLPAAKQKPFTGRVAMGLSPVEFGTPPSGS